MLDAVLLGKTRAAILRETFLNPNRRISFNELVRRVKSGAGAVSRDLKTLIGAGLIVEHREGNHRFIAAATQSPIFTELKALITKTSGVASLLRESLRSLAGKVNVAVIFGSVARGEELAESDLDLLVVGTAGYSVVAERLRGIEERLGRHVQVLYYDVKSNADRASLSKPATKALVSGPKIFVIGDESDLSSLLKEAEVNGDQEESRQSHPAKTTRPSRRGAKLGHAKRPR